PSGRDGGAQLQGAHRRLGRDVDVQRAKMHGGLQERLKTGVRPQLKSGSDHLFCRRSEMPWIEANGASLRYELSGSGRETLVLVHEAGGCIESFEDTLPGLEKEFRVLRYDQRGFGFSEKVRELTFATVVADFAGLLDALRISDPVHVQGCAMGSDF